MVMIDGGPAHVVDIVSAVLRCREQVDDDSQINVDILVCGSPTLGGWTDSNDAFTNYMRYKDIKEYQRSMSDVFRFLDSFPAVNFRYYVQPSEPFPGKPLSSLNADNQTVTWPIQMMGRLDGENAIKLGEGFYFREMQKYTNSPEL